MISIATLPVAPPLAGLVFPTGDDPLPIPENSHFATLLATGTLATAASGPAPAPAMATLAGSAGLAKAKPASGKALPDGLPDGLPDALPQTEAGDAASIGALAVAQIIPPDMIVPDQRPDRAATAGSVPARLTMAKAMPPSDRGLAVEMTVQSPSAPVQPAAAAPGERVLPAMPELAAPAGQALFAPQPAATSTDAGAGMRSMPFAQTAGERPQDISALVDRLVEARQAALSAQPARTIETALRHAEFGAVTVRFETGAEGIAVTLSSPDPDFARAVQAAAPAAQASASGQQGEGPQRQAPGGPLADTGTGDRHPQGRQARPAPPEQAAETRQTREGPQRTHGGIFA